MSAQCLEGLTLLGLGLPEDSPARILVLADGNCSYAAALARARPELQVCATTYDPRSYVPQEHADAVAELLCEVDATEALPGNTNSWQRVVVNFPSPIGRRHVAKTRDLVRRLLARAAAALSAGGQVWLTLESSAVEAALSGGTGGGPRGSSCDLDLLDSAAEAELVLVATAPAHAPSVYKPLGSKAVGHLHILARSIDSPRCLAPTILTRDINILKRGSLEELREEVASVCAPVEVASLQLLDAHEDSWTVRLELRATCCALSRHKAKSFCDLLEEVGDRKAKKQRRPESSTTAMPTPKRRLGWNVWFHKVEPSVEDFMSLLIRPVERAEDANLLWVNAAWTSKSALPFVNHFEDPVLNKLDVALLLRGTPHIPRTFVLPEEEAPWLASCRQGDSPLWIAKPPRLGRGQQISIFRQEDADAYAAGGAKSLVVGKGSAVVSEYISPPYCIEGRKVDLRLYVLVRSVSPLQGFVHSSGGYVRFAARAYSEEDLDPQRNLTNNSINRSAGLPPPPLPDQEVCAGDNWPLHALWSHVDRQLLSCVQKVAPKLGTRQGCRPFAFLGFDVLLDAQLRPWLCEINANPTLEGRRVIDRVVDLEVIGDLLTHLEGGEVDRWEKLDVEVLAEKAVAPPSAGPQLGNAEASGQHGTTPNPL
ncbi:unnamed protein product [Polarella glacialis]|uniref:Tubulin--tyrosine ligase-like protein 5 n=1 Tax=Polarella glacialis TaxID=89957 RepID=A0A813ES46_POLGL|nr:unnamed protein product [Polarella glacialis]